MEIYAFGTQPTTLLMEITLLGLELRSATIKPTTQCVTRDGQIMTPLSHALTMDIVPQITVSSNLYTLDIIIS